MPALSTRKLRQRWQDRARRIPAKYSGVCRGCDTVVQGGDSILWLPHDERPEDGKEHGSWSLHANICPPVQKLRDRVRQACREGLDAEATDEQLEGLIEEVLQEFTRTSLTTEELLTEARKVVNGFDAQQLLKARMRRKLERGLDTDRYPYKHELGNIIESVRHIHPDVGEEMLAEAGWELRRDWLEQKREQKNGAVAPESGTSQQTAPSPQESADSGAQRVAQSDSDPHATDTTVEASEAPSDQASALDELTEDELKGLDDEELFAALRAAEERAESEPTEDRAPEHTPALSTSEPAERTRTPAPEMAMNGRAQQALDRVQPDPRPAPPPPTDRDFDPSFQPEDAPPPTESRDRPSRLDAPPSQPALEETASDPSHSSYEDPVPFEEVPNHLAEHGQFPAWVEATFSSPPEYDGDWTRVLRAVELQEDGFSAGDLSLREGGGRKTADSPESEDRIRGEHRSRVVSWVEQETGEVHSRLLLSPNRKEGTFYLVEQTTAKRDKPEVQRIQVEDNGAVFRSSVESLEAGRVLSRGELPPPQSWELTPKGELHRVDPEPSRQESAEAPMAPDPKPRPPTEPSPAEETREHSSEEKSEEEEEREPPEWDYLTDAQLGIKSGPSNHYQLERLVDLLRMVTEKQELEEAGLMVPIHLLKQGHRLPNTDRKLITLVGRKFADRLHEVRQVMVDEDLYYAYELPGGSVLMMTPEGRQVRDQSIRDRIRSVYEAEWNDRKQRLSGLSL